MILYMKLTFYNKTKVMNANLSFAHAGKPKGTFYAYPLSRTNHVFFPPLPLNSSISSKRNTQYFQLWGQMWLNYLMLMWHHWWLDQCCHMGKARES